MECLVSVVGYDVTNVTDLIQFLANLFQMEKIESIDNTVDGWITNQGGWVRNNFTAQTF